MAAVDVLETELIAASGQGTGKDLVTAKKDINAAKAAAIAKYIKTVVEGGVVDPDGGPPPMKDSTGTPVTGKGKMILGT